MKRIIKNSNENLSFTKILSFIQNIKSILKVNSTLTINPTMDLNSTASFKRMIPLKLSTTLPLNSILKLFFTIFIFNATMNLSTAANNPATEVIIVEQKIYLVENDFKISTLSPASRIIPKASSHSNVFIANINDSYNSTLLVDRAICHEILISPISERIKNDFDVIANYSSAIGGQQNEFLSTGLMWHSYYSHILLLSPLGFIRQSNGTHATMVNGVPWYLRSLWSTSEWINDALNNNNLFFTTIINGEGNNNETFTKNYRTQLKYTNKEGK